MVIGVLVDARLSCSALVVRANKAGTTVSDAHGHKFVHACHAEPPHAALRIYELVDKETEDSDTHPLPLPHTFTPRLLFPPIFIAFADGSKLTAKELHDMWKTALSSAIEVLRRIERTQTHRVMQPLFRLHIQPGTLAVTAQKLNKKEGSVTEGSVKGGGSGGSKARRKGASTTQSAGQEGGRDKGATCGGAAQHAKRGGRAKPKRGGAATSDEEDSEKHKDDDDEERDDAASVGEEEDDGAVGDDDEDEDEDEEDEDGENHPDDEEDDDRDDDGADDDRDDDGVDDEEEEEEEEEEEGEDTGHHDRGGELDDDVEDDDTTLDDARIHEKVSAPVLPPQTTRARRAKRAKAACKQG